jgi:hypothetical protein
MLLTYNSLSLLEVSSWDSHLRLTYLLLRELVRVLIILIEVVFYCPGLFCFYWLLEVIKAVVYSWTILADNVPGVTVISTWIFNSLVSPRVFGCSGHSDSAKDSWMRIIKQGRYLRIWFLIQFIGCLFSSYILRLDSFILFGWDTFPLDFSITGRSQSSRCRFEGPFWLSFYF